MNLLATLKTKGLSILVVVLTTLCISLFVTGKLDRNELDDVKGKLLEHVTLNERLSKQNLELAEQIRNKPKEYIPVVKDVIKEVCNGKVKQSLIENLPRKEVSNVENTQTTADIDDRLPADLIKLLQ